MSCWQDEVQRGSTLPGPQSSYVPTLYVNPEKRLSQSCLKRGLGATCAYPEPDNSEQPPGKLLPTYPDSQSTDIIRHSE